MCVLLGTGDFTYEETRVSLNLHCFLVTCFKTGLKRTCSVVPSVGRSVPDLVCVALCRMDALPPSFTCWFFLAQNLDRIDK